MTQALCQTETKTSVIEVKIHRMSGIQMSEIKIRNHEMPDIKIMNHKMSEIKIGDYSFKVRLDHGNSGL